MGGIMNIDYEGEKRERARVLESVRVRGMVTVEEVER